MNRTLSALLIGLFWVGLFWLGVSNTFADVVHYKSGRKVEGKILEEYPDRIKIRAKMGGMEADLWIKMKEIKRIERGELKGDEFERRFKELAPDDLPGHQALFEWAKKKGLRKAMTRIKSGLPEVERLHKKKVNPRSWCRTCDAFGERKCPECTGTGKVGDECGRCEGKGKIKCRMCGHLNTPGAHRCKKCAGKGKYERFDPAKGKKKLTSCPKCRGKGTHPCPTCEGTVFQKCTTCKGEGGVHRTCPRCDGKPTEVCPGCTGKGIQPEPLTEEEYAKEQAALKKAAVEAEAEAKKKAAAKPKKKAG